MKEKPTNNLRQKKSLVSILMRRDLVEAEKQDKALAKMRRPKTKGLDIFKDNKCAGCMYAIERQDREGPFDEPFYCGSFDRVAYAINYAKAKVDNLNKLLTSGSRTSREFAIRSLKEGDFLTIQKQLFAAAELLTQFVMSGYLPCVSDTSTPQCHTKAKRVELSEPVKRREELVRQSFLESNGDKTLMERVSRKLAKGKK